MKTTIKQKIVAGGIGLSSLINGGCEMTPAQNMAVSGASTQHIAATSPNLSYQQRQSFGAMGGLLGVLSQQEAMKEAARQGKSEVNVNVPQQQNYQQTNQVKNTLESTFFVNVLSKNSEKFGIELIGGYDSNNDGHIDIEKEIRKNSIKKSFIENEIVIIGLLLPPFKDKVRFNLYELENGDKLFPEDFVLYRNGKSNTSIVLLEMVEVHKTDLKGIKKLQVKSYLDNETDAFAVRNFEINHDLNAEQIYRK